jgi:hypothetical protein
MFLLLRLAIFIAGVATLSFFGLRYFGYDINWNYWEEQKAGCQEKFTQCQKDLLKTGYDGAKETCEWDCVDPKILIKKQEARSRE